MQYSVHINVNQNNPFRDAGNYPQQGVPVPQERFIRGENIPRLLEVAHVLTNPRLNRQPTNNNVPRTIINYNPTVVSIGNTYVDRRDHTNQLRIIAGIAATVALGAFTYLSGVLFGQYEILTGYRQSIRNEKNIILPAGRTANIDAISLAQYSALHLAVSNLITYKLNQTKLKLGLSGTSVAASGSMLGGALANSVFWMQAGIVLGAGSLAVGLFALGYFSVSKRLQSLEQNVRIATMPYPIING